MRRNSAVLLAAVLAMASVSTSGTPTAAEGRGGGPLRLVLDRPLHEGGKTRVRLRNRGEVPYRYNTVYEACYMKFKTGSGRRFIVPEGTHCDIIHYDYVAPGETVTLFRWGLDECIQDDWGCTKARDLKPGRYLMRGWFRRKGTDDSVRVTERFRIRD